MTTALFGLNSEAHPENQKVVLATIRKVLRRSAEAASWGSLDEEKVDGIFAQSLHKSRAEATAATADDDINAPLFGLMQNHEIGIAVQAALDSFKAEIEKDETQKPEEPAARQRMRESASQIANTKYEKWYTEKRNEWLEEASKRLDGRVWWCVCLSVEEKGQRIE